jgi:hypothetical protein
VDTPVLFIQQTALEKKIKTGEEHSTGKDRYECVCGYMCQLHTRARARTHAHLHVAIFVSKNYAAVRLLEKIEVDGSDVKTTHWLVTDRQTERKTSDTDTQNLFFLAEYGSTKLIQVPK